MVPMIPSTVSEDMSREMEKLHDKLDDIFIRLVKYGGGGPPEVRKK